MTHYNLARLKMEERRKCIDCKRFLIAQNGHFLHPDNPCSGLSDYIFIEATIEDEVLHEKFIKLYGEPDMDDYERLALYEKKIDMYRKLTDKYENRVSHPIIKFILKVLRR